MAPISLASIHPAMNWVNTSKQTGCHAPLISTYFSVSYCSLVRECDNALGWYHTILFDLNTLVSRCAIIGFAMREICIFVLAPYGPYIYITCSTIQLAIVGKDLVMLNLLPVLYCHNIINMSHFI